MRGAMLSADSGYEMMAGDTLAAMDAGGGGADIVGFSMGARIAIELCLAHPERVRTLTLIAGRPAGRSHRRTRLLATIAAAAERDGGHGLRRQLEAGNGYDIRGPLRDVSVPTLVLHGRRDRLVPIADSRQLARLIPRAELHLMPGCISPSCAPRRSRTSSASTHSPGPGRGEHGCSITPVSDNRAQLGRPHAARTDQSSYTGVESARTPAPGQQTCFCREASESTADAVAHVRRTWGVDHLDRVQAGVLHSVEQALAGAE